MESDSTPDAGGEMFLLADWTDKDTVHAILYGVAGIITAYSIARVRTMKQKGLNTIQEGELAEKKGAREAAEEERKATRESEAKDDLIDKLTARVHELEVENKDDRAECERRCERVRKSVQECEQIRLNQAAIIAAQSQTIIWQRRILRDHGWKSDHDDDDGRAHTPASGIVKPSPESGTP